MTCSILRRIDLLMQLDHLDLYEKLTSRLHRMYCLLLNIVEIFIKTFCCFSINGRLFSLIIQQVTAIKCFSNKPMIAMKDAFSTCLVFVTLQVHTMKKVNLNENTCLQKFSNVTNGIGNIQGKHYPKYNY